MKTLATLIAATAFAAAVPLAANADSYINSKQSFKNVGSAHTVNKQAKSDRSSKKFVVSPASRSKSSNYIGGSSKRGFGPSPKGGR